MNILYNEIKKEFNYQIVHDLIEEIEKGKNNLKFELAYVMKNTFDLTNPVNRKLINLHCKLIHSIEDGEIND